MLRLFKSSKWGYIIGELLLITLGVLLAMAVNNWSNRREDRKKEAFHLQDLQQSLRSDLNELRSIIAFHEESQRSCQVLYEHLLHQKPWNDSFPTWLDGTANIQPFFPQRAAFENLKSLDFNLIKNDLLRATIFQTYEERFEQLKVVEQALSKRIEEHWVPLLANKVRMLENYSIEPIDYTAILLDPQYRNYLGLLFGNHQRVVLVAKTAAMDAELLIRQINMELRKIKAGERRTQELRAVTIHLAHFQNAKRIVIPGSFNDWDQMKDTLHKTNDGWEITLSLKPGVYMYRFIVDEEWTEDPGNPNKILSEYNNYNSILEVE